MSDEFDANYFITEENDEDTPDEISDSWMKIFFIAKTCKYVLCQLHKQTMWYKKKIGDRCFKRQVTRCTTVNRLQKYLTCLWKHRRVNGYVVALWWMWYNKSCTVCILRHKKVKKGILIYSNTNVSVKLIQLQTYQSTTFSRGILNLIIYNLAHQFGIILFYFLYIIYTK